MKIRRDLKMNELESARAEITRIDAEMAKLFEMRMKAGEKIAAYKKETGMPIKDAEREHALIEANSKQISDPGIEAYYVNFLKGVIDLSCKYQTKLLNGMKVSYSGEKGAFAYIAAKKMFPYAELIAYPDFTHAYKAAEDGDVDCVVLPIENNYAGEVGVVMDMIFSDNLHINRVTDVSVSHCLIASKDASADTIKTVISHPQALSQCANYIKEKEYKTESYTNTALAAQYVMNTGRSDIAAIASAETAEIFGLKIIDKDINDIKANTTRFAAFSRSRGYIKREGKSDEKNFILVFTVRNEAGALAQALDIIGSHGFNMRSVRSRPMKELHWSYYFYIEAEGDIDDENGSNMMRELSAVCDKLKLAGTYYAENVRK